MKAVELVTEPLFYCDSIQVGNMTILHRRCTERGICCISHLLREHRAVLCLTEFNMKYGLNTDILAYNGCVQAIKKYIKGLDIAVQSNNSLNMRKSLMIICKLQKGTKSYYDILAESESKPKCYIKWNSTLSNKINLYTTFYKIWKIQVSLVHRFLLQTSQMLIEVPFVMHTMKIFPTCFRDVILCSIFY